MKIEVNANGNLVRTFFNHNGTQTMEVFKDDQGVASLIEWDIPDLDETEHIGLWFEGNKLVDYDGIADYMPIEAIELLEFMCYNMNYARQDVEECWECDKEFNIDESDSLFCSLECKAKWFEERRG
jgi:hypothetical protein